MISFASNIPQILSVVETVSPKRILDVGSGFGKYGLLIRELLLSSIANKTGNLYPEPDFIIDSAEESGYFLKQKVHKHIYDTVYDKNAFDILAKDLESYDLILLIDVVEHWDRELTKQWLSSLNTNILISTPKKVCFYDKEYYDCRKHISQWMKEDFEGTDYSTNDSYIFLKHKK